MEKFKSILLLGIVINEAGVPELKDDTFLEEFPFLFKAAEGESPRELLERTISIARTAQAEIGGKSEAEALDYFIKNGIAAEKAPIALERVNGVLAYFEAAEICQVRSEKVAELVTEAIATYPEIKELISEEDLQAPDALNKQLTAVQVYLADLVEQTSDPATATETAPVAETSEVPVVDTTDTPVAEPASEPVMETPTEETSAQEEPASDEPAPIVAEESNLPAPTVELNLSTAVLSANSLQEIAVVSGANVAVSKAIGQQAALAMEALGKVVKMAEGSEAMNSQVLEAINASIPAQV